MLLTTDARRVYFQNIGTPGTTDDYRTQAHSRSSRRWLSRHSQFDAALLRVHPTTLLFQLLGRFLPLFPDDPVFAFGTLLPVTCFRPSSFFLPYWNSFFPSTLLRNVGSMPGYHYSGTCKESYFPGNFPPTRKNFVPFARRCDTLEERNSLVGGVHPKREKHEAPPRYHTTASRANSERDWPLAPELVPSA